MRAIVVGAGVVGSSVAYRLAQAGARVVLLDAGPVGGGTSRVSYAWVNACEKLTRHDYFALNFAGWRAHQALAEEFGALPWLHRPGVLQWDGAGAEATGLGEEDFDKFARLREWGYPVELLSADDVRRLEPDVDTESAGNGPILHYPEDGWCDGPVYAGAMAAAARDRHGATLRPYTRIAGLVIEGRQVSGVRTADGEQIGADIVVNCAGRWVNEAAAAPEAEVPLAPTLGLIAYTAGTSTSLRRALRTPLVNLRPDGAGRLLLRSNELDRVAAGDASLVPGGWTSPGQPQAQELARRTRQLMPALGPVEVEAVRVAIRPIPKDGFPAIGPVRDLGGYYVVVTHSGVTLAPFLGIAVADEIVHGRLRDALAPFRPARLLA